MDGEYVLLGEDGAPFLDPTKPKAYIVSGRSWVNNHAHVLQAIPNVTTNRFVLFTLNASDYRQYVNGTTRLKLTQGAMKQIPVKLPPFREQQRIVQAIEMHFTRLDACTASLKAIQAKLKRYRAAVLKAAVEGMLTAAWRAQHPDVEPASVLLQHILQERRNAWEHAELAKYAKAGKTPPKGWEGKYKEPKKASIDNLSPLPENWRWATVEQLSYFARYGTSAKTSSEADGVPILRMGNIKQGALDLDDLKYLPATHPEFPDLLLQSGDLLFNRTNSAELVGKSAVYLGNPHPCSYASYLIAVRMIPGCLSQFVNSYLNSTYGRMWIASVVTQQVGQANVNGTKLQALMIPLPPLPEQDQIVSEVERRLSVVTEIEAQIQATLKRAERLRQSILKEAFAGRLVPQDPEDEPADVLLERIRAQKDGRIALRSDEQEVQLQLI